MPTLSPSGRHSASARRPLLAVLTAAFILLQPVAFILRTSAQTRRSAIDRINASRKPSKSPAVRTSSLDDPGQPNVPSTSIVISQVYGGAGCGTAGCSTYKNDYIEIFNRGSSPQSVNGWSVQYAAATGTSWQVTALPNVTVQPGQYLLVAEGAGANGVNNLPTPDASGTIAMSATSAKVALANTTTALSGQCGNGAATTLPASVVDFVGYGATANCNEAGATTGGVGNAPAPSTTNADFRAANGCTDTDVNSSDFTAAAASPRNTASPLNSCGDAAPTVSSTSPADGAAGVALNADVSITFSEAVNVTGSWFTISCATSGAHTAVASGGPNTFTLNPDTDFSNGEVCTVTVDDASVSDQDAADPPDNMAADYVFSFTTASATPSLTIDDVSQAEGNGGGTTAFTFTVSLSTSTHGGVTYDICSQDDTAQDGSNVGEDTDYSPICFGAQTIPNGSDSAQHTVNVNADSTVEPDETFFVNVTSVVGATVSDGQGLGTIVNDDFVITPIHDIQGNGAASPISGQVVTTTGIVTLLKTGQNTGAASTASGFFLQTPDADADPNTSEGIFVFTSSVPTYTAGGAVAVGDELRLTGTVTEFNGLTELGSVTNITAIDTGNSLPTAVTLDATILDPTAAATQPQLEKYEGMRLAASSLTTVAPNDNFFDFYTVLSSVARPLREPGIPATDPVPPDPTSGTPDCCIPIWDENPERLKVDTNGRAGAANTPYTSNVTFTSVSGPLDFGFGEYRLVADAAPAASANMAAVPAPTPNADEFTVVSYNIENFNNNATQRQKAALTIRNILHYPDIIGTIEIFDLADLQALRDQINGDAVAAGDPNPQYEAYLVEADGTSEDSDQDVGFLVKTSRVSVTSVTQEREEATFIDPVGGDTETLHDRPPFVLDAVVDPSGANPRRVLVVVNHLRSFIDIELVAGEGVRVREKRKAQAEDLADLLNDLQTANAGVPVISVGDYNAYQFSDGYTDPVKTIKGLPTDDDEVVVDASPDLVNPDFVNLTDSLPAAEQYSFIFEGTPQALDHHIINGAARARNTRVAIARVNADFPESPASAFASNAATPERNSDHDPVISYYSLAEAQPAGTLIISEFRFHGQNFGEETARPETGGGDDPGGPRAPGTAAENDEYIEFYNNTDSDITVSTIDGSPGWALVASDGQVRFIIPNGTVIPARRHFLAANVDGYSLFDYGLPDPVLLPDGVTPALGYDLEILDESGIALFRTANPSFFTAEERLDAVGYASVPELYREGAGLAVGTEVGSELEHAWLRQMCAFVQGLGCTTPGTPKDTGVNASDFISVDTTGVTQSLGAPGPEGLSSPGQRNADFPFVLLDSQRTNTQAPNRVRDLLDTGLNKQFGTMSIRRMVTNNTGGPVDYLAFRIVQITTFPAPSGVADLRALDSEDITVTLTNGTPVDVRGTYIEQPPQQPNGGALNSSIGIGFINLEGNTLEDGESVSVQFLLGVEKTGLFRFFINIEAFDSCGCPPAPAAATSSSASDSTPEWLTNLKRKVRTSVQSVQSPPRPKARGGSRQN